MPRDHYTITLPFPPSTNTYYRKWRNRMVISDAGRAFKAKVATLWRAARYPKTAGLVSVGGTLTAPDHRRRDLDNFFGKALFDSLKGAAYDDDSQVYWYLPTGWATERDGRKKIIKGGNIALEIQWAVPIQVVAS